MNSNDSIKLLEIERLLQCLVALIQNKLDSHSRYGICTQKELLTLLQISPNTLKNWEKTGLKRLEPPIEGTRTVYYRMEDVLNYLTP